MYGLSADLDLSFLVGAEVIQVCHVVEQCDETWAGLGAVLQIEDAEQYESFQTKHGDRLIVV